MTAIKDTPVDPAAFQIPADYARITPQRGRGGSPSP